MNPARQRFRLILTLLTTALVFIPQASAATVPDELLGYWTLAMDSEEPAWLRVAESGGEPVATMRLYVGPDGPYKDARIADGALKFTLRDRRIKKGSDVMLKQTVTARVKHGTLHGVIDVKASDGSVNEQKNFTGRRVADLSAIAPDLTKVKFGHPISLFNGRDLTGWRARNGQAVWVECDRWLARQHHPKDRFQCDGGVCESAHRGRV